MNEEEHKSFITRKALVLKRYKDSVCWRKVLARYLRYKKPTMVNMEAVTRKPRQMKYQFEQLEPDSSDMEEPNTSDEEGEKYNLNMREFRHQNEKQLYVAPVFLKPGKHFYMVQSKLFASS